MSVAVGPRSPTKASGPAEDVLLIDGVYYDTKKLAAIHPGGELMVLVCNNLDATTIFNSYHRRAFNHTKYTNFAVKAEDVAPTSKPTPNLQDFDLYWSLCEKVKPILAASRGFAPPSYYLKVAFIIVMTIFLDFIYPLAARRTFLLSVLLGWFLGLIGLNIQHDSNHGAVSSTPIINRLLGLMQDYLGGGSIAWMINHNTVHHVHCNDVELDHDLDIPLMRLKNATPWHLPHLFQQVYFFALAAIFGPVHIVTSVVFLWAPSSRREQIFESYRNTSRWLTLLAPLRFLVLSVHATSYVDALTQLVIANMVGGVYLAFFFILSHNFVGVRKEGIDSTKDCFVRNQVETSCNVGYEILCQFNGGLNYQIEHHLFPRVHHSHYPALSKACRPLIEERKISYLHFPTVLDNAQSMIAHLGALGAQPTSSSKTK